MTQGALASGHPSVSVKQPSHCGMCVHVHHGTYTALYVRQRYFLRESRDERRSGKMVQREAPGVPVPPSSRRQQALTRGALENAGGEASGRDWAGGGGGGARSTDAAAVQQLHACVPEQLAELAAAGAGKGPALQLLRPCVCSDGASLRLASRGQTGWGGGRHRCCSPPPLLQLATPF